MGKFLSILLLFTISHSCFSQTQKQVSVKNALIISGGGTRASWGAGFAKGLAESGKEYEIIGGTSAGALIMSSVALNQFEELETLFNTITNDDVYNVNPIKSNGKIKTLKSFWRTIFGYSSIGESKNLRKLIEKIFTKKDYQELIELQKEIFCVVTNLNNSEASIKTNKNTTYTDLLDWIWASASVPVLMAPVEKDSQIWADGGLIDNVPIDEAIIEGSKHIDIIALFAEEPAKWEYSNKLHDIVGRTSKIVISSTFRDNIIIGQLMSQLEEGTVLNIHYMSREDADFLSNLYSFDNTFLSEGFQRGYEAFKNETRVKRYYIMGSNSQFVKLPNQ